MAPKPYKFIGLGDSYGPKTYTFIGFGITHGPKSYKFRGFGGIKNTSGAEGSDLEGRPEIASRCGTKGWHQGDGASRARMSPCNGQGRYSTGFLK